MSSSCSNDNRIVKVYSIQPSTGGGGSGGNIFSGLTVNGDLIVTGTTSSNLFVGLIFSGGTFYGDGSNLTGVVSEDNFTTGATLNGNILTFDRTDTTNAYTVDLSGLVVNSTGGTSNIVSDTEPSLSLSGSTWIRSTDYESFIYDVNRGKWLSVNTNQFEGSRSRINQTDVFLRTTDGSPYNLNPYYLQKNSTITGVVGGASVSNTFNIILSTGTTIPTDIIYTLPILSATTNNDVNVNVDVISGQNLYLYMSGNSIDYPKATVYYKYR
jgi:hypothetical protein